MNMDVIEMYKDSLKSAWGYNDYNDWPIKYNSIMHLFCKEFAEEYLSEIANIDRVSLYANIKTDMNPARIYRMINPVIYGMRKMEMPIKTQRDIVVQLLEMTQELKCGSVFNEDGRNIILSESEVEAIQLTPMLRSSISQKLHRIIGLLWAYTESIFFRAHDITKEMHGLYPYGTGKLLVREFLNLRPTELWPVENLIPFRKIVIYTMYNPSIDLKIDAYNHFFLERGNFVSSLISYKIVVDGVETDIDALYKIAEMLVESIRKIKIDVENMDWRERASKYADIIWYRKRPISILSGNLGNTPRKVAENIKNGEIDMQRLRPLTNREIDFMIRTII